MEKGLAITIAITVPIALVVLVALVVCLIRRFMDKSRMGSVMYDRISHELDDEEVIAQIFHFFLLFVFSKFVFSIYFFVPFINSHLIFDRLF